jgi:hypothetical protein
MFVFVTHARSFHGTVRGALSFWLPARLLNESAECTTRPGVRGSKYYHQFLVGILVSWLFGASHGTSAGDPIQRWDE